MTAFLWFCAAGGIAALVFDILRVLRSVIRHHTAVVMAEDILWCAVCFIASFFCVVRYAGGVVRWFYLAGFFASVLLWFAAVSPWLLRLLHGIVRFLTGVVRLFLRPFLFLAGKIACKRRITALFEKLFSKNSKNPIAKSEQTIV